METSPETLANSKNICVVAPAGYGKTHLIAESVKYSEEGKQLILTHTHAGVRALKDKLIYLDVPSKKYHIETISGFALKYVYAYPKGAGINIEKPKETNEWNQVHEGATRLLDIQAIKEVINISYKGLYVDEYQDCTIQQHNFIMKLREILPCRILGDPLQGIFDFKGSRIVDWDKDVFPNFKRLPDLETPHRWKDENPVLGRWLSELRKELLQNKNILLTNLPIGVGYEHNGLNNDAKPLSVLYKSLEKNGSIIGIHRGEFGNKCHHLASKLNGSYQSMEEIESKALFKWASKIDSTFREQRIQMLIDFSGCCFVNVITELKKISKKMGIVGTDKFKRITKNKDIYILLSRVLDDDSLFPVLQVLKTISKMEKATLFRKELWDTMIKSIKEYNNGEYNSLFDAAWAIRNIDRKVGRKVDYRCLSRTLLIKGLECEHAIVLDADNMNYKELYVALTRGSKSLTIISQSNILYPKYN